MSTAAALGREEADRVEAEEAEEEETETETETEVVPVPETEPPVGEKAMRAMETEESRHAKAVEKVMGEAFAGFQVCPLCEVFPSGFVPAFASVPDEMAAELGQAAYNYFQGGDLIEPPYLAAQTMTRCEACDGWGRVLSGAQNADHRVEQCAPCFGNGFVAAAAQPAPTLAAVPAPAPQAAGAAQPAPYRDVHGHECYIEPDATGRLWGDPAYGQPATGAA